MLAAGKGTRMKSIRPKVLHQLNGRPIIDHVLRTVDHLKAATVTIVVGHGADDVRRTLQDRQDLHFVVQSPQLGTGHALLQTESVLSHETGDVLVLYADIPLLQARTLDTLIESHRSTGATATILTVELDDPYGYGRVIRDRSGLVERIVEERDASAGERALREVNSGLYVLAIGPLFKTLHRLATDNSQGEYYLTDLIGLYRQQNLSVEALRLDAASELRGVNSRNDLAEVANVLRARKNADLMRGGVTLDDPLTTYIEEDVAIGADTIVGPGVQIQGRTSIGQRCRVHGFCRLVDAAISDDVTILDHTIIVDSSVAAGASVGPFAHVRPQSEIGRDARVGNFVELKKTALGPGSKANHLAYLGDATIGEHVNVGAGTITCNYDGETKNPTVIEDNVFIGSDSQLIAPVTIGKGAYVAAGSSITSDVPPDSLAISRARQENKPGWAAKRRTVRAVKVAEKQKA